MDCRQTTRNNEPATEWSWDGNAEMDAALKELTSARDELARIPHGLSKYQREAHLSEPLSRLSLVNRFIVGVLAKNGWAPIALEGST